MTPPAEHAQFAPVKEGTDDLIDENQPKESPSLTLGMSIAVLYNYYDDNFKENRLEWCNAATLKLSMGRNMRTNPGNRLKCYRKG